MEKSDIENKLQILLNKTEEKYKNSTSNPEKLSHINLIIQLRTRLFGIKSIDINYRDSKLYIDLMIDSVNEGIHGYDYIDRNKIKKLFRIFDTKRKYNLYKYLERRLKQYSFEDELSWAMVDSRKEEISYTYKEICTGNKCVSNTIRLFSAISSLNILTMVLTLFFIVLFTSVLLLPASSITFQLFNIKYSLISENFYINHFLNVIGSFVGIENSIKVMPNGNFAFALIVLSKIFTYLVIANFLIKEIEKRARS